VALSTGFFRSEVKHFPALLPDATVYASLANATANQQVFQYGPMAATNRLLTLRSLQTQSVAGVSLAITADGYNSGQVDSAAAALLAPFDGLEDALHSDTAPNTMRLQVSNASGSAAANYWLNWSVLCEKPSLAQRLKFRGSSMPALTPADEALARKLGLLGTSPRGLVPRTFEWIRDNEFRTQIVTANPVGQTQAIAANTEVTFFTENARSDEVLALVLLMGSPGSGSDGLTTTVQVDGDQSFLTLANYPAFSGKPLPMFILAEQQIIVTATATSTLAAASLVGLVWHIRKTDEIRYRMGDQNVPQEVKDKIDGGVL
jgi:hypothetical protein